MRLRRVDPLCPHRTPRRRSPRWVALLVLVSATPLVLSSGAGAAPPRVGQSGVPGVEVTGYAVSSLGLTDLRRDAPALTTYIPVTVTLHRSGARLNRVDARAVTRARLARRLGLRTEMLISNHSAALGDFDRRALRSLLRSPVKSRKVARALAALVQRGPWTGVNLDLEGIDPRDRDRFTRFLRLTRQALPRHLAISVDVPGETSLARYRRRGVALAAVGRIVDRVQVMSYDRHHPAWTGPGPVSPLAWQRAAIVAALRAVPARKIEMGVAGYGHYWRADGSGSSLSPAEARAWARRDAVVPTWDETAGEWTARFRDGTVAWWGDQRSYRARLQVAGSLRIRGVALWRLGSADPLVG